MANGKPPVPSRRRALGIVFGLAAGLSADLALLVWLGPEAFRNILMVTTGLIVIVPASIGIAIGTRVAARGTRSAQADAETSGKLRVSVRRRILGLIVGLAAGVFVDALLVLKYRVPILYFVVFSLGLILIMPIAFGIHFGLKFSRSKYARDLPWPVLILLAMVLWSAAIVAPFGAQMLRLRMVAHDIVPVYPGAKTDKTIAELGDGENTGDRVRMAFHVVADSSSVLEFYREGLAKQGWKPGPQRFIDDRYKATAHWFERKYHRPIRIKFASPEGETLAYEVVYGL